MTFSRRQFLQTSMASALATLSGQLTANAVSVLNSAGTIPLSVRSVRAIAAAREFAREFNAARIDSVHLLMGLVAEAQESAATWLPGIGADLSSFQDICHCLLPQPMEEDCHCLLPQPMEEDSVEAVDFSDKVHLILSSAQAETLVLQHQAVQPEHILLALLHCDDCAAHEVLHEMWFEKGAIEREALLSLGESDDQLPA